MNGETPAAPRAASGETGDGGGWATVRRGVDALRPWAGTHVFDYEDGRYWAAHHDRPGSGILRAGTPEELSRQLAAAFGPGQP